MCTHMMQSFNFHFQTNRRGIWSKGGSDPTVWSVCVLKIKKMKPLCKCLIEWNWFQTLPLSAPSSRSLSNRLLPPFLTLLAPPLHPLFSLFSFFYFFSSPTCIAFSASRSPSPLQASEKEKESPVELTERCFRELLGRAAYGNIKNAVTPVLMWVCQLFHTQNPVVV